MTTLFRWVAAAFVFLLHSQLSFAQNLSDAPIPTASEVRGGSFAEFMAREMRKATLVELDESSTTRIYGGRPARPGAWPAQVGLHLAKNFKQTPEGHYYSHICGGSIIARQWILTAAHCVVDAQGKAQSPNEFLVRTGATRITEGDIRKIVRVIVHENYDPAITNNDIALLQLAEPIRSSSGPVAAIPVIGQDQEVPLTSSVVIGWGKDDENRIAVDLLETDIDIVSSQTCNEGMRKHHSRHLAGLLISFGTSANVPENKLEEAYGILVPALGDVINRNMICAGVPSGKKTSCQGDSGGPLMVRQANGKWLQVGIVSWGATSVNRAGEVTCGVEQTYAVYTRLSNYFNWIANHVRGR